MGQEIEKTTNRFRAYFPEHGYTQVGFFMDSDRCAQKANIDDQQQRILFNPGGSCIQHVTTKDKPAENSRHKNHGNTGNDGIDIAEEI
jgi:hypothetical protein